MSPICSNDLLKIFNKLDKNCDGLVCLQELHWLLDRIGIQLTMEELESSLEKPSLDFNEFLFFYESISKRNKGECNGGVGDDENEMLDGHEGEEDVDIVYMAFKVFDMNDDGFISCEELRSVLLRLELWDSNRSDSECRNMIRAYDTNLDGKLDFEEFKNMMLLTTS
ncbi:probable calcium-binding protein CML44 [Momordica charantia]|uniref:Probable calcium-binding protein CML44 n=1 Tax=Momordica charantia TaxID=3673 RepID=A0A6J1CJ36_MOMCH|nr:probable calcium-binding protein CML44 [Momordica charantia]